jgi:hypothetical protein
MTMNRTALMSLLALTAACSGEEETTAPPDDGSAAEREAMLACDSGELQVGPELSGAGFDRSQGGLLPPLSDSYVVHTTQLVVRPDELDTLFKLTGDVVVQANAARGMVALSLARDEPCNCYRTLGVWADEEQMLQFVVSGAHREAMERFEEVALVGRTTSWHATADEVNALTWEDAIGRLAQAGAY